MGLEYSQAGFLIFLSESNDQVTTVKQVVQHLQSLHNGSTCVSGYVHLLA